jgi:transposase InsO family protein
VQQITASGSEQIWVADITYIPTKKQTVYLSLITDAYSRGNPPIFNNTSKKNQKN